MNKNYEWFHQANKKCLEHKKYTGLMGLNILSLEFIKKYGILFIAENHGEILGGNLYFHDEKNVLFVEGACKNIKSNIENKKRSTDANCYLHWEAIQYFKDMDIINYDIGEVPCNHLNINHQMTGGEYFKRSFGGDVTSLYKYLKFNSCVNKLLFHSWNFLQTKVKSQLESKNYK